MKYEIVCAGIGGRGVLLASTIIMETAIRKGLHATASDEYGMSQRGGSVVSLVKVGDFRSPLIGRENADILLAFEESEFFRTLSFLRRGGAAIVNSRGGRLPVPVSELLKEREASCYFCDADGLAQKSGTIQASNMVILGFFSFLAQEPFTFENLEETIKKKTSKKFVEKNLELFREGHRKAKAEVSL
jgi:indolepyruvate ferredoxin oxidoreductase beta subunit